jgi:hypothetical protein
VPSKKLVLFSRGKNFCTSALTQANRLKGGIDGVPKSDLERNLKHG